MILAFSACVSGCGEGFVLEDDGYCYPISHDSAEDVVSDVVDDSVNSSVDRDGDGYSVDVDCNDGDQGQYPGTGYDSWDVADADCDGFFTTPTNGVVSVQTLESGAVDIGPYYSMLTYAYSANLAGWAIKEWEGASEGVSPPAVTIEERESPTSSMPGAYPALVMPAFSGEYCVSTSARLINNADAVFTRVIKNTGDATLRLTERLTWGNSSGMEYVLPSLASGEVSVVPSGRFMAGEVAMLSVCSDGASPWILMEPGMWHVPQ